MLRWLFHIGLVFLLLLLQMGSRRVAAGPPPPLVARRPLPVFKVYQVDIIVLNQNRKTQEVPNWLVGEVTIPAPSVWWFVFVQRLPKNKGKPFKVSEPVINRGWAAPGKLRIVSDSHGWAVLLCNKAGVPKAAIVAPVFLFITTPYDYDVRNRARYQPIPELVEFHSNE